MSRVWLLALILTPLFPAGSAAVDEGMWLPPTVATGPMYESMKARGLELAPGEIWNDEGPSLGDAMVMVGGAVDDISGGIPGFGSAAFVSSKGLILTNHHVAFDAISGLSTKEHNHVVTGFIAGTMVDERSCPSLSVQITTGITDVSERVLDGIAADDGKDARDVKIAENIEAVLAATREAGSEACTIKEMRLGTRYHLFEFEVLRDIRMVYAPPQMIGEYGGDIDNWMWPRHTGDFSYLRAYVAPDGSARGYDKENVPYQPRRSLDVSIAGYEPGDFCFIMGHPGTTWRYRTSYSVHFWETVNFPRQIKMYESQLTMMEEQAATSEESALRLGPTIKQINNALKNFRGMVDGFAALDVVERRQAMEHELSEWIAADAERKARYGTPIAEIEALYEIYAEGTPASQTKFVAGIGPVRRRLADAIAEFTGKPLYSDANMTLRFTNGNVEGYSPRDAVNYDYVTSMAGLLQKHTGEEPFNVPEKQRKLIMEKDWGRFGDKDLGTVPTCFLSTTDITGGNSGSPIMNARGQMIGIAFDGNYEGITSDFLFEEEITRTINVDIRYVLWCTEKLAGLDRLLEEMNVVGG